MSALNYAPFEIKSQSSSFLLLHSPGSLQLISPLRVNTAVHSKRPLFLFLLKTIIHLSSHRMSRAESLPFPWSTFRMRIHTSLPWEHILKESRRDTQTWAKHFKNCHLFFPTVATTCFFPSLSCWLRHLALRPRQTNSQLLVGAECSLFLIRLIKSASARFPFGVVH